MFTLNAKGKLLPVTRPLVMGIINRAPDSFYSGSRFPDNDSLLQQVEKMAQEGADWLDIGGQKTPPGPLGLGEGEKIRRGGRAHFLNSTSGPRLFLLLFTRDTPLLLSAPPPRAPRSPMNT